MCLGGDCYHTLLIIMRQSVPSYRSPHAHIAYSFVSFSKPISLCRFQGVAYDTVHLVSRYILVYYFIELNFNRVNNFFCQIYDELRSN